MSESSTISVRKVWEIYGIWVTAVGNRVPTSRLFKETSGTSENWIWLFAGWTSLCTKQHWSVYLGPSKILSRPRISTCWEHSMFLLAARKHGIQRLVYASSSAVYGDIDATTWHEGNEGLPLSPYALTKRINESYALLFHRLYGVSSIGLRYFNVYGPRQDPNSDYSAVIPRFIGALLRGERPTVYGTGKQSRDFVYVDDVVEANWLALNAPLEAVGRIYNIGTGVEVTVLELATLLAYLTGMKLAPKYEAARPEDVMRSCASPTLARNMLGFEAPIPLREGLRQTIQWYKNNFSSDACTRFTSCSPHPQLPLRSGCRSS